MKSPFRYPGGKSKAIKYISAMMPEKAHEYRETMVGGGSVFFHAQETNFANEYWINDKLEDLMLLYKAATDEYMWNDIVSTLRQIHKDGTARDILESPELWLRHSATRATLFFLRNRCSFSGSTYSGGLSKKFERWTKSAIDRLEPLPKALEDVDITCGDFEPLITTPGEDVFIFLDPPYITASRLYGKNGDLHEFDHERLLSLLQQTEHRFLMTYDDCPEIREMYKDFKLTPWSFQYGMANGNGSAKTGYELFIQNY